MKKILPLLLLSTCAYSHTFDGTAVGLSLSTVQTHHTLGNQSIYKKKTHDYKNVGFSIVTGTVLEKQNLPIYLGAELNTPFKNPRTHKKINTVIAGQQQKNEHEIQSVLPIEASFKLGYLIDEKVMLFTKFGFVHQKINYKIKELNHSASWSTTQPIYSAGITFKVNCKWLMNAEFIAHNTTKHNTLIFNHEQKHERIQFSVQYKI